MSIRRHYTNVGVLIVMHHEAFSRRGWNRRGVRGWKFRVEVERIARIRLPEIFPGLYRRGLLERVPAEAPGLGKPAWLYRISHAGARAIEAMLGWERHPIPEPWPFDPVEDLGALYAPAGVCEALTVLRQHAALPIGLRRFGEPGWMTAAEVIRDGKGVRRKDLAWLLSQRMVERRRSPAAEGRAHTPWCYRIAELGMQVEITDAARNWAKPPLFVQLRIAERVEPGPDEPRTVWAPDTRSESPSESIPQAPVGPGRRKVDSEPPGPTGAEREDP